MVMFGAYFFTALFTVDLSHYHTQAALGTPSNQDFQLLPSI